MRELGKRNVLTRGDRSILEVHCRAYARWRLCCDDIETEGVMVDAFVLDSNGEAHTKRIPNPCCKMAQQLETQLRNTLAQLSATPTAREKAKRTQVAPAPTPPGQDPDPILDL